MPRSIEEFRQGDVFLVRLPKTHSIDRKKPVTGDGVRVVLAFGEITGHAHALPSDAVELHEIDWSSFMEKFGDEETTKAQAANTRLLRVLKPTDLQHEEHAPIPLEPGDYMVSIQLDFDEDELWSSVGD